jgi:hypothetical protein
MFKNCINKIKFLKKEKNMLSFKSFLIEAKGIGSISASGSNANRHYKQYHSPEAMEKLGNEFTFASDSKEHGFKAGDKIKLDKTEKNADGKYYGYSGDKKIIMSRFQKPRIGRAGKDQASLEARQIEDIQKRLNDAKSASPYIRLHVGNGKFVNVAGVKQVDQEFRKKVGYKGRDPKADFYFHDEKGEPVSFHSLKGSETSQQWGGISADLDNEAVKTSVQRFKSAADEREKTLGSREHPTGLMLHHNLDENNPEHRKLIHRAMYGINHGEQHGINNVNSILVGDTSFSKSATPDPYKDNHKGIPSFDLSASEHHYVNTNNEKSDISPSKIINRKAGTENSAGINAGRILIVPNYAKGYKSTVDVGENPNVEDHMKELRSGQAQRKVQRSLVKQENSSNKKPVKNISTSKKENAQHGGKNWLGPSESNND